MTMWILVAHQGGARILERPQADEKPRIIETIDHPQGRLKDSEIVSDQRGQTNESAEPGVRPMEPGESPSEHVATTFAKELAQKLSAARSDDRYHDLVLVAAPQFLGLLREALDDPTGRKVKASHDKDFAELSDHDLVERVEKLLAT